MSQNTIRHESKPNQTKYITVDTPSNILDCLSVYNQGADEHIGKTSCDELSVMILIGLEAELFALQNS